MSTEKNEKPLDKMTVKELREVAKEIPELTGVHGMNKPELLEEIMKAKGIEEKPKTKSKTKAKKTERSAKALKKAIKAYRKKQAQAVSADDKKKAAIYKRKISRLKKKTRNAA
jgi:DNA-binding ferritin-like protein